MSDTYNRKDSDNKENGIQDLPMVSSCMAFVPTSHYPLPHVATVVNQSGHRNLEVEKSMLDSGSQISLVSMSYLDRHRHISNATIIPLAQPCSLKSATGRSFNPFKGKTVLSLRFVDTKGKLTRKTDIEFHVLQKSSQLEGILLGLNFWSRLCLK